MTRLALCLALLMGCQCDPPYTGPRCDTLARCKSPECVNSGCRFDDAGRPLPKIMLGALEAEPEKVTIEPITINQRKPVRLNGSMQAYVNGCSDDPLGAVFALKVEQAVAVDVSAQSSEQVSLAIFQLDTLGERRLKGCSRGFAPSVEGLRLEIGNWEFALTGREKAVFEISETNERRTTLVDSADAKERLVMNASERIALQFDKRAGAPNKSVCSQAVSSYRVQLEVEERVRLSFAVPKGTKDVYLGLHAPNQENTFCPPPINQQLNRILEKGVYELIVETDTNIERLNAQLWQLETKLRASL